MHKSGFSLVELSIVLVILGLLTGGILTGQSLIRAAELRSVTTERQTYITAIMTFRDKYFALPGDMRNATDFWGSATCPSTAGTGTQTCDGNGDGVIDHGTAASQYNESFTFWQHLANAGLIEGSYIGMSGPSGQHHAVLADNVPRSKISSAGWSTIGTVDLTGTNQGYSFAIDYGNELRFGGPRLGTGLTYDATLTPEETWNIDTKVDDGKPGTGKAVSTNWDVCTDAATNGHTNVSDITNSNYALTDTSVSCAFFFPKAF